jgi:hypothetical protein
MDNLPSEIVVCIARLNNETWYKLVQVYKFLYIKSLDIEYSEELKRKFLFYSTRRQLNVPYTFKYNDNLHEEKEEYIGYKIIYYLPNGSLHTFEEPCIITHVYLHVEYQIWYKNNKIHRDNDEPAIIIKCNASYNQVPSDLDPIILSLDNHDIIEDLYLDNSKLWVQNNHLHRENNKPTIEFLE